jgi:hypothetical protein
MISHHGHARDGRVCDCLTGRKEGERRTLAPPLCCSAAERTCVWTDWDATAARVPAAGYDGARREAPCETWASGKPRRSAPTCPLPSWRTVFDTARSSAPGCRDVGQGAASLGLPTRPCLAPHARTGRTGGGMPSSSPSRLNLSPLRREKNGGPSELHNETPMMAYWQCKKSKSLGFTFTWPA